MPQDPLSSGGVVPSDPGPAAAFRKANRIPAALAVLAAGWTIFGTSSNLGFFLSLEEVFGGSKVPLPGLTLLFLANQPALTVLNLVIAATCVFGTFRKPDRPGTFYLNTAGIVVPLMCWILQTTTLFITETSILRGIRFR